MVERQLPKLNVAGSNPVSRSNTDCPKTRLVLAFAQSFCILFKKSKGKIGFLNLFVHSLSAYVPAPTWSIPFPGASAGGNSLRCWPARPQVSTAGSWHNARARSFTSVINPLSGHFCLPEGAATVSTVSRCNIITRAPWSVKLRRS